MRRMGGGGFGTNEVRAGGVVSDDEAHRGGSGSLKRVKRARRVCSHRTSPVIKAGWEGLAVQAIKAVHTQGGAHTRQSVATGGVLLFKGGAGAGPRIERSEP